MSTSQDKRSSINLAEGEPTATGESGLKDTPTIPIFYNLNIY